MEENEIANYTVLVAEDESISLYVLGTLVQWAGGVPILVRDGKEAWEYLESGASCDALLTDLKMPNMSGEELIAKIRKTPSLAKLPIIIVSGVNNEEVAPYLSDPHTAYLEKPIDHTTFKRVLSEMTPLNPFRPLHS